MCLTSYSDFLTSFCEPYWFEKYLVRSLPSAIATASKTTDHCYSETHVPYLVEDMSESETAVVGTVEGYGSSKTDSISIRQQKCMWALFSYCWLAVSQPQLG